MISFERWNFWYSMEIYLFISCVSYILSMGYVVILFFFYLRVDNVMLQKMWVVTQRMWRLIWFKEFQHQKLSLSFPITSYSICICKPLTTFIEIHPTCKRAKRSIIFNLAYPVESSDGQSNVLTNVDIWTNTTWMRQNHKIEFIWMKNPF